MHTCAPIFLPTSLDKVNVPKKNCQIVEIAKMNVEKQFTHQIV
jgi:hypothetical protein